ncbi:hypothetical protein L3X38_044360 [Prunus dulcis]|uniref:Uncharacterized protein n=1 Tax=Prunus dulcis TaxID=3755 RepID=A0AAD4UZT0_PRUDU|nr:hypothetical protein L3X38_044360 [Prunus dulcis]
MRTVGFLKKIQSEPSVADTWHVTVGADVTTTSTPRQHQLGLEPSRNLPLGQPGLVGPAACPGWVGRAGGGLGLAPAFCLGQPEAMEMA